ncbi:MAG: hypothetical protein ACI8PZ_001535 [Myxococcota bacterium]|jgi:hypothetical protein
MHWRLAVIPALVAAGCSCNEQEYSFPDVEPPVDQESPEVFGDWLSMDASPDGQRLTIAYHEYDFGAVGFAVGTPAGDGSIAWRHERVDGYPGSDGRDVGDRGSHTTHAVASDGTVWLAYSDLATGGLFASQRASGPGSWAEPTAVEPGAGAWASLALDAANSPVVAHVGADGATVRVSRFAGGAWSTDEAYKSSVVIIPAADTGSTDEIRPAEVSHTSLLIDDGTEYLVFHDAAAGTLVLLEGVDGAWSTTVVDSGDVGAWASLGLEGDTLWVAYQDVANQDLKVATRDGGGAFSIQAVDTDDLRGADTALVLGSGAPRVAYFDGWNGDLRLATRAGGSWSTDRIAGDTTAMGFHNATATVASGTWIGTWDMSQQAVRFLNIGGDGAADATGE